MMHPNGSIVPTPHTLPEYLAPVYEAYGVDYAALADQRDSLTDGLNEKVGAGLAAIMRRNPEHVFPVIELPDPLQVRMIPLQLITIEWLPDEGEGWFSLRSPKPRNDQPNFYYPLGGLVVNSSTGIPTVTQLDLARGDQQEITVQTTPEPRLPEATTMLRQVEGYLWRHEAKIR